MTRKLGETGLDLPDAVIDIPRRAGDVGFHHGDLHAKARGARIGELGLWYAFGPVLAEDPTLLDCNEVGLEGALVLFGIHRLRPLPEGERPSVYGQADYRLGLKAGGLEGGKLRLEFGNHGILGGNFADSNILSLRLDVTGDHGSAFRAGIGVIGNEHAAASGGHESLVLHPADISFAGEDFIDLEGQFLAFEPGIPKGSADFRSGLIAAEGHSDPEGFPLGGNTIADGTDDGQFFSDHNFTPDNGIFLFDLAPVSRREMVHRKTPDRSCAGRIDFAAICHKYASENFLLHNSSDDVALPLLSSGGGFTLILSKYLPISAWRSVLSQHTCLDRYGMVTALRLPVPFSFQSGLSLSGFSVPSILAVLFSDFSLARALNSSIQHHLLPLGFHLESLASSLPRHSD